MAKNLLKKWMDENIKNTESLPKSRDEFNANMRGEFVSIDALSLNELETFAKDGKNKIYVVTYANCLLKARQTGNYVQVNRIRKKTGMQPLKEPTP